MDFKELVELPNISKVLASKLAQAGIKNTADLFALGAKEAFFRMHLVDHEACINILYALEGAVQGIRWHNLDRSSKIELKMFFDRLNGKIQEL